MKLLKSKKGLTIVELVVSLAILGLVATGVIGLFTNSYKHQFRSEQTAIAQRAGEDIIEELNGNAGFTRVGDNDVNIIEEDTDGWDVENKEKGHNYHITSTEDGSQSTDAVTVYKVTIEVTSTMDESIQSIVEGYVRVPAAEIDNSKFVQIVYSAGDGKTINDDRKTTFSDCGFEEVAGAFPYDTKIYRPGTYNIAISIPYRENHIFACWKFNEEEITPNTQIEVKDIDNGTVVINGTTFVIVDTESTITLEAKWYPKCWCAECRNTVGGKDAPCTPGLLCKDFQDVPDGVGCWFDGDICGVDGEEGEKDQFLYCKYGSPAKETCRICRKKHGAIICPIEDCRLCKQEHNPGEICERGGICLTGHEDPEKEIGYKCNECGKFCIKCCSAPLNQRPCKDCGKIYYPGEEEPYYIHCRHYCTKDECNGHCQKLCNADECKVNGKAAHCKYLCEDSECGGKHCQKLCIYTKDGNSTWHHIEDVCPVYDCGACRQHSSCRVCQESACGGSPDPYNPIWAHCASEFYCWGGDSIAGVDGTSYTYGHHSSDDDKCDENGVCIVCCNYTVHCKDIYYCSSNGDRYVHCQVWCPYCETHVSYCDWHEKTYCSDCDYNTCHCGDCDECCECYEYGGYEECNHDGCSEIHCANCDSCDDDCIDCYEENELCPYDYGYGKCSSSISCEECGYCSLHCYLYH